MATAGVQSYSLSNYCTWFYIRVWPWPQRRCNITCITMINIPFNSVILPGIYRWAVCKHYHNIIDFHISEFNIIWPINRWRNIGQSRITGVMLFHYAIRVKSDSSDFHNYIYQPRRITDQVTPMMHNNYSFWCRKMAGLIILYRQQHWQMPTIDWMKNNG
jgi:hypothetical protein